MEYQQSDTDTNSQSAIGVGRVEQITQKLHEIQPSWVADGHGIRGPQEPRYRETARQEPMEFGLPVGSKSGFSDAPGACAPIAPPDETDTYLWGTIAGVCQWIPVCEAPCP